VVVKQATPFAFERHHAFLTRTQRSTPPIPAADRTAPRPSGIRSPQFGLRYNRPRSVLCGMLRRHSDLFLQRQLAGFRSPASKAVGRAPPAATQPPPRPVRPAIPPVPWCLSCAPPVRGG